MSFDLTRDEIILILAVLAMVLLPSRLGAIGNALGRLLRPRKPDAP